MQNSKLSFDPELKTEGQFKVQNLKKILCKTLHFELCTLNSRQRRAGFTLIELVTVIAILVVVGSISGVILFTSLRGSSKTNALITVRQSGENALTQMEKLVRSAKRFDGISPDGTTYSSNCSQTGDYLKMTDLNEEEIIISCGLEIASNSASLTDQNLVSVETCSFSCSQTNVSNSPTVKIEFSLLPANNSSNLIEKSLSNPLNFSTSVTLRNSF